MLRKALLMLCVPVVLAGCDSSQLGESPLTKGLDLPAGTNALLIVSTADSSTSAAPNDQPVDPPIVHLDSASINLLKIKLHTNEDETETLENGDDGGDEGDEDGAVSDADDEDDGQEIDLMGPFLVDLMAETVLNLGTSHIDDDDGVEDGEDHLLGEGKTFDALTLPEGTYNRIRFRVRVLHAEHAPSSDHPMIGYSIRAAGTIDGVPFEYCARINEDLEVRSADGIVVTDGSIAAFVLTFDPASWFADVDPSQGSLSDDGVLQICDDSNPELAELIRDRIHRHVRFGHDHDGDGDDDNDETEESDDD